MKSNKPFTPRHPFLSLVFHPHFLAATVIAGVVLFLLLAGCSSNTPNRFNSKNYNDCDLLLKKRYSHARSARQPKMNTARSTNKKSPTVAKKVGRASKYELQD